MVDAASLARLALFADLARAQLESVAHMLDEERHPRGSRVLREGLAGNGFYVILDGEASVQIGGEERARLHPGDFFGEVSIFTGDPAGADVSVASEELHVLVLGESELRPLLHEHPAVAVRMLEAGARRLQGANRWGT
jgi:CRP-like cAMP-binding protein